MVETLTDKNLELGEQIESLKETVQELVGSKFIWMLNTVQWGFIPGKLTIGIWHGVGQPEKFEMWRSCIQISVDTNLQWGWIYTVGEKTELHQK